jgi:hypothetical protein
MIRPQVADEGDGPQIWRETDNQSRTAENVSGLACSQEHSTEAYSEPTGFLKLIHITFIIDP